MSFNSSRNYGILLNTTFQKLIIVEVSTGFKLWIMFKNNLPV